MARVQWAFYTEIDAESTLGKGNLKMVARRQQGQGFRCYYKSPEDAKIEAELLGVEFTPQMTWHFFTPREQVINFADRENLNKFTDPISFEVGIVSLQSSKRHPFHLIALPAAVVAMAKILGYETSGFNLSELTSQETIFTDELQASLLGKGYDRKRFGKMVAEFEYETSLLWQRRQQLWKELGEENPSRYTVNTNPKTDTSAEKLAQCLQIVSSPWKTSAYLRLLSVNDPKTDAVFGDENKRLSIPVIGELFNTKKDAEAAAKVDIERASKNKPTADKPAKSADGLVVPIQWAEMPEDWKGAVRTLKEELKGKPLPVLKKELKSREESIGATAEEILAWWNAT